jgi:hypothetical protein
VYKFCTAGGEGNWMEFKQVVRNGMARDNYLEFLCGQVEPRSPKDFCAYDLGSFRAPRHHSEMYRQVWIAGQRMILAGVMARSVGMFRRRRRLGGLLRCIEGL